MRVRFGGGTRGGRSQALVERDRGGGRSRSGHTFASFKAHSVIAGDPSPQRTHGRKEKMKFLVATSAVSGRWTPVVECDVPQETYDPLVASRPFRNANPCDLF